MIVLLCLSVLSGEKISSKVTLPEIMTAFVKYMFGHLSDSNKKTLNNLPPWWFPLNQDFDIIVERGSSKEFGPTKKIHLI